MKLKTKRDSKLQNVILKQLSFGNFWKNGFLGILRKKWQFSGNLFEKMAILGHLNANFPDSQVNTRTKLHHTDVDSSDIWVFKLNVSWIHFAGRVRITKYLATTVYEKVLDFSDWLSISYNLDCLSACLSWVNQHCQVRFFFQIM